MHSARFVCHLNLVVVVWHVGVSCCGKAAREAQEAAARQSALLEQKQREVEAAEVRAMLTKL